MKYIKLFESVTEKEHDDLIIDLDKFGIKNYTINDDGTIDVDGDVDLSCNGLVEIPFIFRNISGAFDVSENKLETLKNSPIYVGNSFNCSFNNLTSLKFGPIEVGGTYRARYLSLENLDGLALEIGLNLVITNNNKLKDLNAISNIEGIIYCDENLDTSKFGGYCKGISK